MPRKVTTSEEKSAATPSGGPAPASAPKIPAPAPEASTLAVSTGLGEVQDRLDMVLLYLHNMDRRDKWRTRGGFLRGLISIIPVLIAVWAAWYFYMYGDILMKKLTMEVVRQSAAYSENTMENRIQQLVPLIENLTIPDDRLPPASPPADSEPPAEAVLPEE